MDQARAFVHQSLSQADTAAFAARLAELAVPGTVLAVDGDLGAGKTLLAKAYAQALGVRETVSSPTFTIIKEYESGRLPFYHMDVYRLSLAEADELGLDEYLLGGGVSLIEWASRIGPLLPPERLHIRLEHVDGDGWAGAPDPAGVAGARPDSAVDFAGEPSLEPVEPAGEPSPGPGSRSRRIICTPVGQMYADWCGKLGLAAAGGGGTL